MGERLRLGLKRKGIDIGGGEEGDLVVVEGRPVVSPGEGRDMMVTDAHRGRKIGHRGGDLILVFRLL